MTGMLLECEACGYTAPVVDIADISASCPECEGALVLVPEDDDIPETAPLQGVRPELPPLPSWDGSDTQTVRGLARGAQPELAPAAPIDQGAELSDRAAARLDDVETVHVERGTAGRGSRAYDRDDLGRRLGPTGDEETRNWGELDRPRGDSPADSTTRSWAEMEDQGPETREWGALREGGAPAAEESRWDEPGGTAADTTGGWEGRLFPVDPDWEALLEESLPEQAEDDPHAKRRVVHLPPSAAPTGDTLDAAQVEAILRPFGIRAPLGLGGSAQDQDTAGWKDLAEEPAFALEENPPPPQRSVTSLRMEAMDPALVVARRPDGPESSEYRGLLARLGARPRTLLVTSAARREGRTSLCLNLALAVTRRPTGQAIVVEADLDGSGPLAALGVSPTEDGLLSTLRRRDDPRAAMVQVHLGDLMVVPRGVGAGRDLLGPHLGEYLRALRSLYPAAWILVDGPPAADGAAELLPAVEGALLVVRRGRARREAVAAAAEAIGRADLLGAVFNAG